MPETVRSAIPVSQALTVGDRAFVGMDTYTDPNKLQDGICQRITNLVVQNGSLVPRKGWQAQTTNALAGSYYDSVPVRSTRNAASSAVLAAADGSGLARFWKFDSVHNDAVPIPMSASGTLTFSNIDPSLVRLTQFGRYIYAAPGKFTTATENLPLRIDTKTTSQKITTVAIGTNKFTKAGHTLTVADPIVLVAASGSLPSPLALDTPYYVSHVNGSDFYVATSLPTSTSTSAVSHVTFSSSATTVDIVTTFKGETLPSATGLINVAPIAETYPVVDEDIAATAHQTVTTNFALRNKADSGSGDAQMLSNANFASPTSDGPPTSWTQFASGNLITVKPYSSTSFSSVTLTSGGTNLTAVTPSTAPAVDSGVTFTDVGGITNLSANQTYYVVYSSGSTFRIATAKRGTAISLTGTTATGKAMTAILSTRPIPSSGYAALFDADSQDGVFPGIKQDVDIRRDKYTLADSTTQLEASGLYALAIRVIHFDQPTTARRRPINVRLKALKYDGVSAWTEIDGAVVVKLLDLNPTIQQENWSIYTILADFRAFKSLLADTGKVRVEIQNAANFGKLADPFGLYLDYAYLYAIPSIPKTSDTNTGTDKINNLVPIYATKVNSTAAAPNYGGFVKDRHFYYAVTTNYTVTLNANSAAHASTSPATAPPNGTPVSFTSIGTITGPIAINTTYFIVNSSGSSFGLSATFGGAAISLTGTTATGLTMVAGINWQNVEYASIQYRPAKAFESLDPSFSIGIQNGAATTTPINWGPQGSYDSQTGYITFPLDTYLKGEKNHVKAVYIRSNQDFTLSSNGTDVPANNGEVIFYIGKLVHNGELQGGGKYEYAFTRWKCAPAYTTTTSNNTFLQTPPYVLNATATVTLTSGSAVQTATSPTTAPPNNTAVTFLSVGTITGITAGTTYYIVNSSGSSFGLASTLGGSAISLTGTTATGLTMNTTGETFFGGVESAISKVSVPVTTTNAESRTRIRFSGTFRDVTGDGYTHVLIYRRNVNTFSDGKFRLIGQVDVVPATPALVGNTTGLSIESGASQSDFYIIDNLGDSEILFDQPIGKPGYIFRDGKDFFPVGAETIAVHQQRLWMSKNNTLYASWLLDNDNEYALHTTLVPIAGDPLLPVKGASFDVSGQFDNEPITAIVPFSGEGLSRNNSTSNALLVLRNNSILPVTGSDASTFTVLGFVNEPGVGCIAPNCAQTMLGRVWWLSNSGIMQYTGGLPTPASLQLDRLVNARSHNPLYNPTSGNLSVDQSLQRQSSSIMFDGKFIFTSSQPGGTTVNTFFVFDTRANGWYEWSFVQGSTAQPRSMYVLNSALDAPELYVAASNGRIYKYTGSTDKETTASSETPFTWAVLSRSYGQTYAQGQAYYAQNRISQLDLHVDTTASLAVNWRVFDQTMPQLFSPVFNNPSFTFYASGTWTFTAGNKAAGIRNIARDIRGTSYTVQLSGSSLTNGDWFRIYGLLAHVTEGGIRRRN
jgi:hypothetical protein